MSAAKRFNVRVYGIWIHDGHLLVSKELIKGHEVWKLPGGGLEMGEGTIDGLKREWEEELGLSVEILAHFYTTDFYQPSAFDDSQVISIYYLVAADPAAGWQNKIENEQAGWVPLGEIREDTFTLPIDRVVGRMLMTLFQSKKMSG